ncbi:hypothetical protein TBR22_A44360 [Luteitalea sp. TBR-22]|uniref:hypothetical protein n=1 Tax=Luteitalea sp. TBR-22 TaxID=2802971 RepID=UPI001AF873ED|nr:hypothetical protein [Luteitalea sp. TBR-22]BCS35209.1 hypothetical protein TBR22_A44360 [Luteitalea sp. TBR-22]
MLRRDRRLLLALPALLLTAGCFGTPRADEALEVYELKTGYDDGGVEAGQNRLLPTVSFKLRNKASRSINSVQVNAVFRVLEDPEELGSQSVWAIDYQGLASGQSVGPFVMRSRFGYSGEQARVQMFQHQGFKDVVVQVFAKQGGNQWVKLTEQVVDRQLLAIAPAPAKAAQ